MANTFSATTAAAHEQHQSLLAAAPASPLQEQAHALFLEYESNQRGRTRSRSAARLYKTEADFERELLMERAERNLDAGLIDDEECQF
jgi:hypothetical protein